MKFIMITIFNYIAELKIAGVELAHRESYTYGLSAESALKGKETET